MVYKNYKVEFVNDGKDGISVRVNNEIFSLTTQEVLNALNDDKKEKAVEQLVKDVVAAYEFERDPEWGNIGRGEI